MGCVAPGEKKQLEFDCVFWILSRIYSPDILPATTSHFIEAEDWSDCTADIYHMYWFYVLIRELY